MSLDCYGTLIDWEDGILRALRPVLSIRSIDPGDRQILEFFAELESRVEAGPYISYREVLKDVVVQFGERLGFEPRPSELSCLCDSLKDWRPFPDVVEALQTLRRRFPLAIVSNIDDDLFTFSANRLQVEFDWVITAEQVKSYKPSLRNFQAAIERIGIGPDRVLHIAQSIYHDIKPAKAMGLSTVWVNRRKGKEGFGATLPTTAHPDLEVPDLKTLVSSFT